MAVPRFWILVDGDGIVVEGIEQGTMYHSKQRREGLIDWIVEDFFGETDGFKQPVVPHAVSPDEYKQWSIGDRWESK